MTINYLDFPFVIQEHIITASHFREYPQAVLVDGCELKLCIKQYTPKNNPNPSTGDITLIVSPGIGYCKELYEPLYEDILERCSQDGIRIRNIWAADPTQSGQSAVLNTDKLGNDVYWFDHSRDLLNMINHFRTDMIQPMMGIGHSAGGCSLYALLQSVHPSQSKDDVSQFYSAYLSILHPRLLTSLVLIEPAISQAYPAKMLMPQLRFIVKRREIYPCMDAATSFLAEAKYYAKWDPRSISRLQQFGFVSVDSSNPNETKVKTTTSKAIEAASFFRSNVGQVGKDGLENVTEEERLEVPDADPDAYYLAPLYRTENVDMWRLLPSLRPQVMYIVGGSTVYTAVLESVNTRTSITGTGIGGSGGAKVGAVVCKSIDGGSHNMPMEKDLGIVANEVSVWLGQQQKRWKEGAYKKRKEWEEKSVEARQAIQPGLNTAAETFPEKKKAKEIMTNPRRAMEKL